MLRRGVVEAESKLRLVVETVAGYACRLCGYALISVGVVGELLLSLVILILGLGIELFGIFEVLASLVGAVVGDIFLIDLLFLKSR